MEEEDLGSVKTVWDRVTPFDWEIENFSQLPDTVDYRRFSPKFHFCGRTWYLGLYPNGEEDFTEGYCQVVLYCRRPDPPFEVRASLGIRTANGETEFEETSTCTFTEEGDSFYIADKTIERWELFRRREVLLPLNVLTVRLTLRATLPAEGTKDASVQAGVENSVEENRNDQNGEKTGKERIAEDVGKMWPDGDLCDVVIRVGDTEFKAHKAILSARTPVLGAMFRHDTAEKSSGEATIEDCEPAVFEQLLHFVYKGAPRELTAVNASPLYVLADKYLVTELKALCLRCMMDTLSVDTFCSTVTVSLMHREDELLQVAIEFFARNMLRVVKSVQWQIFLRDHTTWGNEILVRAAEIGIKSEEERRPDGDSSGA